VECILVKIVPKLSLVGREGFSHQQTPNRRLAGEGGKSTDLYTGGAGPISAPASSDEAQDVGRVRSERPTSCASDA
jgi:hypothetical protein